VRSHPASKWAPHFGKAALARTLGSHQIDYVFLGRELGGRPEGAEFYRENGSVDYERGAAVVHIRGDARLEPDEGGPAPARQLGPFR